MAHQIQILFVDDDVNLLQGLRRMLRGKRKEWRMHFVNGGEEALRLMAEQAIDVVVTDSLMPGMSGTELLERISERHPRVIRLMLSGQTSRTPAQEVVFHAHQFLAKPCEPDLLIARLEQVARLHELLTDEQLQRQVANMGSLPSLPDLYLRLIEALRSPDGDIEAVGDIIAEDIGMTTKILQMVNSAFFGLPQQITSPARAANLLGLDTVTNLALGVGAFSDVDESVRQRFRLDDLWRHSQQTAALTRRICKAEGISRDGTDEAVLAALLHDIGVLVLASQDSDRYQAVSERLANSQQPLYQVERELLGCDHCQVGAYLIGLWGLPLATVEAVAYHHDPAHHRGGELNSAQLVYIANALVQMDNPARSPEGAPVEGVEQTIVELIGGQRYQEWQALLEERE